MASILPRSRWAKTLGFGVAVVAAGTVGWGLGQSPHRPRVVLTAQLSSRSTPPEANDEPAPAAPTTDQPILPVASDRLPSPSLADFAPPTPPVPQSPTILYASSQLVPVSQPQELPPPAPAPILPPAAPALSAPRPLNLSAPQAAPIPTAPAKTCTYRVITADGQECIEMQTPTGGRLRFREATLQVGDRPAVTASVVNGQVQLRGHGMNARADRFREASQPGGLILTGGVRVQLGNEAEGAQLAGEEIALFLSDHPSVAPKEPRGPIVRESIPDAGCLDPIDE